MEDPSKWKHIFELKNDIKSNELPDLNQINPLDMTNITIESDVFVYSLSPVQNHLKNRFFDIDASEYAHQEFKEEVDEESKVYKNNSNLTLIKTIRVILTEKEG